MQKILKGAVRGDKKRPEWREEAFRINCVRNTEAQEE